jgi:hypothetical protein
MQTKAKIYERHTLDIEDAGSWPRDDFDGLLKDLLPRSARIIDIQGANTNRMTVTYQVLRFERERAGEGGKR